MYLICCAGLCLFRNIFSWEFGLNDLRCWCPSNVWLHCKEWCQGRHSSSLTHSRMQTLGCNRSWASVFIIYHVTTQTDLLCYQPYQLLAQLRAKEAQNCRRYNWLMMRKLMGKFYFLITRIIRSAETRSFRRNFKIYTQHSQIF